MKYENANKSRDTLPLTALFRIKQAMRQIEICIKILADKSDLNNLRFYVYVGCQVIKCCNLSYVCCGGDSLSAAAVMQSNFAGAVSIRARDRGRF